MRPGGRITQFVVATLPNRPGPPEAVYDKGACAIRVENGTHQITTVE